MHFAKWAEQVSLVVRGDSLAKSMSKYLIDVIAATDNIETLLRSRVIDGRGRRTSPRCASSTMPSGTERELPADGLFVMIGASPHTSWLPPEIARDAHGFVVAGAELIHDQLLDDWLLPLPDGLRDLDARRLRRGGRAFAVDEAGGVIGG